MLYLIVFNKYDEWRLLHSSYHYNWLCALLFMRIIGINNQNNCIKFEGIL